MQEKKNLSKPMKIVVILLSVLVLAFTVVQLFGLYSQHNIETYAYTTEQRYEDFEIRSYDATLFTSVKISSSNYKEASSKGFSVLAGYIFGDNARNEKIAMTSPVAMSLEDSTRMYFMVPKKFQKETLPQPNQSGIEFRTEPAKRVAAISFKGWANDKKIAAYRTQLTHALDKAGISYTNRYYFLGYNAPYEVFGRKNEIIVELPSKVGLDWVNYTPCTPIFISIFKPKAR